MKKLFLILVMAAVCLTSRAQAVSDMAIIPIGVTLNSIARLTVTSGGNIEFVVNTMDQYNNGVAYSASTTTTFSVVSQRCKPGDQNAIEIIFNKNLDPKQDIKGLVFINGKPMAIDSLWKNGTAAQAYWLWRSLKQ